MKGRNGELKGGKEEVRRSGDSEEGELSSEGRGEKGAQKRREVEIS